MYTGGADVGNVDASRSNARLLNNDATNHQGYVRVVMGFGIKGMENNVWPQTWLSGMI